MAHAPQAGSPTGTSPAGTSPAGTSPAGTSPAGTSPTRTRRSGPGRPGARLDPAITDTPRAAEVRAIARQHAHERGPLLVILHDVQSRLGHIADADIPLLADVLNLSHADVHGVVSFYHDFRRTPPPAHTVTLCRAEACQAVGAEPLYAAATAAFASREDVEVGEVFCLGNCALGPSGMVDGILHGRLSTERIAELTEAGQ